MDTVTKPKPRRGRKPKYNTDEERRAAYLQQIKEFRERQKTRGGFAKYNHKWLSKPENKDYFKNYYQNNKDKPCYNNVNKEYKKAYDKRYSELNKEKIKQYQAAYREKHKLKKQPKLWNSLRAHR